MFSGSFGVSEQAVIIKEIDSNKNLTESLKLTRIIFKPNYIVANNCIIPFFK
jgi:hypothetical protein